MKRTMTRDNFHVVTGRENDAEQPSGTEQPSGLETSRPNIARMYDYWLGGKDNFLADRQEAERMLEVSPDLGRLARENRLFLRRAVHWLATDCGIRQ
ncbi:MAG: SAM-dependent methyltransferase, partial [Solirubrobacteraceae bacterium]